MVSRTTGVRLWRGLSGLVLAALCASGCDGQIGAASPAPPSEPLYVQIGTALPPAGVPTAGVRGLVRGLYAEGLVLADRVGRISPRLAAEWKWLQGGKVLELKLRRGVTFHDGSPMNSASISSLLQKQFADDPYGFAYRSVTRIEVRDELTLRIHLARPEALILEDIADETIAKGTIGTGPFAVVGQVTEQGATLQRFDSYHLGQPGVERVDVKTYPSLRNAWSAMLRGEINMLHEVSREAAQFVEAESSVRTYPMLRPYVNALFFNVRHPVLSRREVRQALNYAVDRDAIVRDVMAGRGERADGPVWKYHWAFSTAQKTYDYNPELARLMLDAAGFRKPADGGDQMPSRFRFTCLMFGDDARFERMAVVLQKQLYDVGIDMRFEAVPLRSLLERFSNGKFDAVLVESISGRSLTWLYRHWRSKDKRLPGELNSGYTAADATLDRLRETFGDVETKQAVGELQRIFHEDPPAIFVAWPQTSRAISAGIHVPYENSMDVVGRLWRAEWAAQAAQPRAERSERRSASVGAFAQGAPAPRVEHARRGAASLRQGYGGPPERFAQRRGDPAHRQ
jgi:peptide/nickel transport system substrate-binding protein